MKLPHCAFSGALVAAGRQRKFDSKAGNSKGLYPKLIAKENHATMRNPLRPDARVQLDN